MRRIHNSAKVAAVSLLTGDDVRICWLLYRRPIEQSCCPRWRDLLLRLDSGRILDNELRVVDLWLDTELLQLHACFEGRVWLTRARVRCLPTNFILDLYSGRNDTVVLKLISSLRFARFLFILGCS